MYGADNVRVEIVLDAHLETSAERHAEPNGVRPRHVQAPRVEQETHGGGLGTAWLRRAMPGQARFSWSRSFTPVTGV